MVEDRRWVEGRHAEVQREEGRRCDDECRTIVRARSRGEGRERTKNREQGTDCGRGFEFSVGTL